MNKCIIQGKSLQKRKDLFKWILWKEQKEILWKTVPFFYMKFEYFIFFPTSVGKKWVFPSSNEVDQKGLCTLHGLICIGKERSCQMQATNLFLVFKPYLVILAFQSMNWSPCGLRKVHVYTLMWPSKMQSYLNEIPTLFGCAGKGSDCSSAQWCWFLCSVVCSC